MCGDGEIDHEEECDPGSTIGPYTYEPSPSNTCDCNSNCRCLSDEITFIDCSKVPHIACESNEDWTLNNNGECECVSIIQQR